MTKQELIEFLKDLLGIDEINRMIDSQITRFMQSGYTAKNIARSVFYYVEVKKQTYDSQYGIGIVPHIHDEAVRYFVALKKKEEGIQKQKEILMETIVEKKESITAAPKLGRKGVKKIDITTIGKKEV